jgi:indolepyruvate ferredoxin oxidoreductase beta subunit
MRRDIVIVGVGGQGTVLASRLIAQAAIDEGAEVRTAETIGMAQRGGSVLGYVRLTAGDSSAPLSPLVGPGQADLLLAFEPAEAARNLALLAPGGSLIAATKPIVPLTAQQARDPSQAYDQEGILAWLASHSLSRGGAYQVQLVDAQAIMDSLGSNRVLNVILLGVALALGVLGIGEESLRQAMQALIKPGYLDLNQRALDVGKAVAEKP